MLDLYQGIASAMPYPLHDESRLQALQFWEGPGFSRAVRTQEKRGLQPLRDEPELKDVYELSSHINI